MDVSSHPPAKRACSKQSKSASVSRLPYLVNKRLDARVRRAAAAYVRARLRLPDQLAAGSFIASAPSTRAKTGAEISTVVQFFSFFFGSFPAQNTTKSQVWSRASTHSVLARGGGGFAGAAGHFLRPQMYGVSICCFISRFDYLITVTVTSRP
jgi:hypothetical protein